MKEWIKWATILGIFAGFFMTIGTAMGEEACINCHKSITPGIVSQYENSAMAKAGVTCLDCHGEIKGINDPSVINHNGYRITSVVSPLHCQKCHPQEYEQFMNSKHAWTGLIGPYKLWYKEAVSKGLVKEGEAPTNDAFLAMDPYENIGKTVSALLPASGVLEKLGLLEDVEGYKNTLNCEGCHGSAVIVKDGEIVKGWPNNGVGRLNPDGSVGSCSACHTRHKFDKAEARKPETCGQCHLGPDHPQMEIYEESKHGNVYFSLEDHSFLKEDKLTPENTPAPTCAVCHMSGFNGAETTHDVGERLYWELQPAISTPQWYPSNLVALGKHKPDEEKANENRVEMKKVCKGCHSPSWVDRYFIEFDQAVADYNTVSESAKAFLDKIYEEGLADKSNPLDEYPEIMWYYIWHHDGRRWRMGASMMGYDFAHWNGIFDTVTDKYGRMLAWYETQKKIENLEGMINTASKSSPASETESTPKPEKTESTPGFDALSMIGAMAGLMALYRFKYNRRKN